MNHLPGGLHPVAPTCGECEAQPAAGELVLSGPAGRLVVPACIPCATDALSTARCGVTWTPIGARA